MFMFLEIEKIKKDKSKQVKLIYSASSLLVIILKIIVLALRKWSEYCWWEFGLITADTFKHFDTFKHESYIIDVKNDACKSLKSLTDRYCDGFCGNLDNFETAGFTMIILSGLSMTVQFLCLGFHVWNYFYPDFKFRKIWVFMLIPPVLFLAGFLSWVLIIKPQDIKDFSIVHPKYDQTHFKLNIAFYLAIVALIFDICVMIYGFFKSLKEFLPKVKVS